MSYYYYFRPTTSDFWKWCQVYIRRSEEYIKYYEKYYGIDVFLDKKRYKASVKIQRQFSVLIDSLDNEARDYLIDKIIYNNYTWKSHDYLLDEIYENWKQICFPHGSNGIKKLDPVFVGRTIRIIRMEKGYSVRRVAELLGIDQSTLYGYEMGRAMIRADVLYGLSQIYDVDMNEIVYESQRY